MSSLILCVVNNVDLRIRIVNLVEWSFIKTSSNELQIKILFRVTTFYIQTHYYIRT